MSKEGLLIIGPETLWVAEDHLLALAEYLSRVATKCAQVATALLSLPPPEQDPWAAMDWGIVQRLYGQVEECGHTARGIAGALREYASAMAAEERARVQYFDQPRDIVIAAFIVSLSGGHGFSRSLSAGVAGAAASVLGPEHEVGPIVLEVVPGNGGQVVQASTLEERIMRIPPPESPIRVERYVDAEGRGETEVFIAGTGDWTMGTGRNPFDLESNVALVAGISAASYIAVEMALKRSGVRPGDRVRFIGHSQGGLIAARMAESGRYTTTGLLTAGAPLGSLQIHGRYPAVSLAHTDDLVPRLAGAPAPTKSVGIERHSGSDFADLGGAHSLEAYAETAAHADLSPARAHFGRWSGTGSTAELHVFRASRTPSD
jgi:predicted esterase